MKKFQFVGLLVACLTLTPGSLSAAFVNSYDVVSFTLTNNNADGTVDLTGAPASIMITGGDNGSDSFGTTLFTVEAAASGLVSFAFDYMATDIDGPFFDPFGFTLNGIFTQLTNDNGGVNQSGSVSFMVMTGDIFGFESRTTDNLLGAATTTISNFQAPEPTVNTVPEPASMTMLGVGIACLAGGAGFRRRGRKISEVTVN